MSLYYHVANKEALLDGVDGVVIAEIAEIADAVHNTPENTLGWCDDQTEFEFSLTSQAKSGCLALQGSRSGCIPGQRLAVRISGWNGLVSSGV